MTSFTLEDIMETLKLLDLLKWVLYVCVMRRYYNGQYILTLPQNLIDLMSKPVGVKRRGEM